MPSPIPAGRVLFLALWLDSTTSGVSVSGWTRIGAEAGYYYFYKVSAGSDTATATWTGASSSNAVVLLLSPNVSVASPIASHDYDSSTSAAAVSGLSDAARYAIAGVAANVASPGSGFIRLGGGTSSYSSGGGAPSLVQYQFGEADGGGGVAGITFSAPVTTGNVVVAVPFSGGNTDTWSIDPRQGGTCPPDSNMVQMVRGVNSGSSPGYVATGIMAKVAGDTYAGPYNTKSACDSSWGELVLFEFSNLSTSGYQAASSSNQTGSPVNLGTFTVGANDVTIMSIAFKSDDNHDPVVGVNGFTQILDAAGFGFWMWVGYKVGNGDASVTLGDTGANLHWGAGAVVLTGGVISNTAGTLAGKYIGHVSTATSPFTGAAQQNDAIFAVNLLQDAKPAVLLYGPDLGGGSSISIGSNSTDVSGRTALGAGTLYAPSTHEHTGVVAVTSSSSNTLQRPTVNLRPGTGIAFGLTDTDGNGAFDTLTVVNTGVPGPPGSSFTPATGRVTLTSGNITTTSTSFVDLTGASITITTGAHGVLLGFSASAESTSGSPIQVRMTFAVDGTDQGGTLGLVTETVTTDASDIHNVSFTFLTAALSAGSHTFKVRWRVSTGTGLIFADSSTFAAHFWAIEQGA